MNNALSKVKTYSKGFLDATLIGTAVIMGIGYADKRKQNKLLIDRVKEQEILIQRFGWPKTQTEAKKYSKIPKGKPASTQQPTNPIGFC
jgi:hypothetical protein